MQDLKQVVTNCFVNKHGIVSYPKSDGRVEIPNVLMKRLVWRHNKMAISLIDKVYVSFSTGEIVINRDKPYYKDYCEVKVTDSRIRIPVGIIKKAHLVNIPLYFITDGRYIIARGEITNEKVSGFINSLNKNQLESLCSLFASGLVVSDLKTIQQNIATPNVENIVPELIVSDADHPTVFRIVGGPFTFPAVWLEKTKEIVRISKGISDECVKQLYLIPGIQIQKKFLKCGFLLVQEETFSQIRQKILEHKKDFPEIILFHDNFVPGGLKIYINPPTDIGNNEISKAQNICKEPMKFLKSLFRIEEWDDVSSKNFPTFVLQNLHRIGEK